MFGHSPFGYAPFATAEGAGAPILYAAGAGASSASATAQAEGAIRPQAAADGLAYVFGAGDFANDPYWDDVVFLADYNPFNGQVISSPIIDYAGHTVQKGAYPRLERSTSATGGGYLQAQAGVAGYVAYVDGSLPEFAGFGLANAWTIETRLWLADSGIALTIQANSSVSPLTVRVEKSNSTTYQVCVQPQGTATAYYSESITATTPRWASVVLESDGSSIWVVVDGVVQATTTSTATAITTLSDAALVLCGFRKTTLSHGVSLDETRITKASRYGGSGYPANPWPYYNGIDTRKGFGTSSGEASAAAYGTAMLPSSDGEGVSSGTSTATARAYIAVSGELYFGDGLSAGEAVVAGVGGYGASSSGVGQIEAQSSATSVGRNVRPGIGQAYGDALATANSNRVVLGTGNSASQTFTEALGYAVGFGEGFAIAFSTASAASQRIVPGVGHSLGWSKAVSIAPYEADTLSFHVLNRSSQIASRYFVERIHVRQ